MFQVAVERQDPKMKSPKYEPLHLATLLPTFNPAEYNISLETWGAPAEQLTVRSWLKREYLL